MAKKNDAVSLYFEICQLADALEGARGLLYSLNEVGEGLGGATGRQALDSGVSIIGLLVARLRLIGRVLYGDADPAALLTLQNHVSARHGDGATDALLRPWPKAKQADLAEAEALRIRSRLARNRG